MPPHTKEHDHHEVTSLAIVALVILIALSVLMALIILIPVPPKKGRGEGSPVYVKRPINYSIIIIMVIEFNVTSYPR